MHRRVSYRRGRRHGGSIRLGNAGTDFDQGSRRVGFFGRFGRFSGGLVDFRENGRDSFADFLPGYAAHRSTGGGSRGFHYRLCRGGEPAQEYNQDYVAHTQYPNGQSNSGWT